MEGSNQVREFNSPEYCGSTLCTILNRNQSLEVSPSIRMVDASEIIGVQGRAKVLESEHIERIYHCIKVPKM